MKGAALHVYALVAVVAGCSGAKARTERPAPAPTANPPAETARTFADLGPPVAVPIARPQVVYEVVPSPDGLLAVLVAGPPERGRRDVVLDPRIIDLERDEIVATLGGHDEAPWRVEWVAGGRFVATYGRSINLFDATTGKRVGRMPASGVARLVDGAGGSTALLTFQEGPAARDGSLVDPSRVLLLDAPSGKERMRLSLDRRVKAAGASPTEDLVVVMTETDARGFERDGRERFATTIDAGTDPRISFSKDGGYAALSGIRQLGIALRARDGAVVARFTGAVTWHPTKPALLAYDAAGGQLEWFDLESGSSSVVDVHEADEVVIEPATNQQVVLLRNGDLLRRADPTRPFSKFFHVERGDAACHAGLERGRVARLVCHDVTEGRAATIELPSGRTRSIQVAVERDMPVVRALGERFLLTCPGSRGELDGSATVGVEARAWDGEVLFADARALFERRTSELVAIDPTTGRRAWTIPVSRTDTMFAFHRARPYFAVGGPDSPQVVVRDAKTGEPVWRFDVPKNAGVRSIAFDPTEDLVAVALFPFAVRVFEAKSGKPVTTLKGAESVELAAAAGLAFTSGQQARLWDTSTWRPIATIPERKLEGGRFVLGAKYVAVPRFVGDGALPAVPESYALYGSRDGKLALSLATGPTASLQSLVGRDGERLLAQRARRSSRVVTRLPIQMFDGASGQASGALDGDTDADGFTILRDRFVITTADDHARLVRIADRRSLTIFAVERGGQCRAVVMDEDGHFEGDVEDAGLVVRYRLGDDLERAKIVRPSDPAALAMKREGLLRAFLGD